MEVSEVYKTISEFNIAEPKSMGFKSACIIWWALHNDTWNVKRIAWAFGYTKREVEFVLGNLRSNGILTDDYKLVMGGADEDLWMEFILIAMAGAGEIRRYDASKEVLQNVTPEVQNIVAPEPVAEYVEEEPNLTERLNELHKDVKLDDIFPLPNTWVRILINDEKNWIRPIKVEGSLVTGIVHSIVSKYYEAGEKIQFSYLAIIAIQGKRLSQVEEIKKGFEVVGKLNSDKKAQECDATKAKSR